METWNREELYAEVWEKPLVKVAPKYGISDVALAKVCRKLQIPLPLQNLGAEEGDRGSVWEIDSAKPNGFRRRGKNGLLKCLDLASGCFPGKLVAHKLG